LLREARRKKGLPAAAGPEVFVLDPDGDVVRYLRDAGRAERHPAWACYHTDLYAFRHDGREYGIVGSAVGAAFAVLIAEELFASGCQLINNFGRSDRSSERSTIFRCHQQSLARRGHELSLYAAVGV